VEILNRLMERITSKTFAKLPLKISPIILSLKRLIAWQLSSMLLISPSPLIETQLL